MSSLIKVINKFNGNLCFIGKTSSGDMIFECERQSGTLLYDLSTKEISDICLNDDDSYYVVFSDNWIGRFEDGVLDETYIDTNLNSIDKIIKATDFVSGLEILYLLDRNANQLRKITIGS